MTKTRFNNLLKNHQKFEKLNGIRHSNRVQRKSYNRNFTGLREVLIVNWAIQNAIDISPTIGKYYRMSLPNFLGTSVGYSKKNTSELYKRIDHFISTLGDLDVLAELKASMEGAETKAAKAKKASKSEDAE